MAKRHALFAFMFAALVLLGASRSEAGVIFAGSPTVTPLPFFPIPLDTFLLPIQIAGASNLQNWQFDLLFDNTVVQVVDPLDGSSGIYGAQFTVGDPDSIAFILGGFALNGLGLVDDVAGFYPFLFNGVSGDGVLAYILFAFLDGQENNDPDFQIPGTDPAGVPEPASLALLLGGLLLLAGTRAGRVIPQHRSPALAFNFNYTRTSK